MGAETASNKWGHETMRDLRPLLLKVTAVISVIGLILWGCNHVLLGIRRGANAYELNEALWVAAGKGDHRQVKRLLAQGAYPSYTADGNSTVLMVAWGCGDKATINAVLATRPDLNYPLAYSTFDDDANFAKLLLSHGADPDACDRPGHKTLDLAKERKSEKVLHLMQEALKRRVQHLGQPH